MKYLFLSMLLFSVSVFANPELDYELQPVHVAKNTYVLIGKTEDFSRKNGGNIVNTGFIVTTAGVVVIDTGPSLLYGKQMREVIATITDQPINRIYLTHHHPDHFFGNQAFEGVPVYAAAATLESMRSDGEAFADNLYRMAGDWMKGTEPVVTGMPINSGQEIVGDHTLQLIVMSGHTAGDLVIYDETTGVLFAGDLVFNQRTLTTPNADINKWLASLARLQIIPYRILVPGHGAVTKNDTAIVETKNYLQWLDAILQTSVHNGLDMTEVMKLSIPEEFQQFALLQREFVRSIAHLYPRYERRLFEEESTAN